MAPLVDAGRVELGHETSQEPALARGAPPKLMVPPNSPVMTTFPGASTATDRGRLVGGVTEGLAPLVDARRAEFPDEDVKISRAREVSAPEVHSATEPACNYHVARSVHRHRLGDLIGRVSEASAPFVDSPDTELDHEDIC